MKDNAKSTADWLMFTWARGPQFTLPGSGLGRNHSRLLPRPPRPAGGAPAAPPGAAPRPPPGGTTAVGAPAAPALPAPAAGACPEPVEGPGYVVGFPTL